MPLKEPGAGEKTLKKTPIYLCTLFVLLFITACGTFEVGVYQTATPVPAVTHTGLVVMISLLLAAVVIVRRAAHPAAS